MSANQTSNQYTMTIGLYLGGAYSLVVFIGHLFGVVHFPGDNLSMFNMVIFIIAGNYAARHYRDKISETPISYGQAFGLLAKMGFFSSVIFGFFGYFYYQFISPGAIDNFIGLMSDNLKQWTQGTDEQREAMLQLYKSTINPGSMAFLTWFYQALASTLFCLVNAILVRTPQKPMYN